MMMARRSCTAATTLSVVQGAVAASFRGAADYAAGALYSSLLAACCLDCCFHMQARPVSPNRKTIVSAWMWISLRSWYSLRLVVLKVVIEVQAAIARAV
jgi:hypothetical protein